MRSGILLAAVAGVLLLAGCASGAAPRAAEPSPSPGARVSLEGRYGPADMGAFLDAVSPMVAGFFESAYPRLAAPRIVYVARAEAGRSPCYDAGGRPGSFDSQSFEYCPANATVYIGQDLLWSFYRIGDAAPVVGLAHEWGHHLQVLRRVPSPRNPSQSVDFENQADCVSGAWARYADEQGWLELPDDLGDIESLLQAIGTRERGNRDHGTTAERARAFGLGFESGIAACNRYSPSAPLT